MIMSFPFNFLKNIKDNNGTIVVLSEKGDPQYVILPYQAYLDLITDESKTKERTVTQETQPTLTEQELLANINDEFTQCDENQNPTSLEEDYCTNRQSSTSKLLGSTLKEDDAKEEQFYLETIDET